MNLIIAFTVDIKSEGESENENAEDSSDVEIEGEGLNAGWADSVAKILKSNKPKGKKTLVLSKAKKLTDPHTQKPKPLDFQIAGSDSVEVNINWF